MSDDKLVALSSKFRIKRAEISNEIREYIEKMATLGGLKEVQVRMLSLRQRLLEDSHTLIEHLSIQRKKYRSERSKQMEDVSQNMQHRYQYNEKNIIIDGKTTVMKETVETLENQIAFFTDSIKTIDNVLFGIKTRVEIEKTLGL